jgi:hypothetical protein
LSAICPRRSSGMDACMSLSMERRCKKIMTTGRSLKPGRINAGQDQKIEEVAVLVRQSTVRRKTRGRAKKRDPATPYTSSTSNACVLIPLQDEKAIGNGLADQYRHNQRHSPQQPK